MVVSSAEKTGLLTMTDLSGANQFTSSCTDQEYLILRAKEALAKGNLWEAKTWMMTAKAIYPDNFNIQFEAYLSEKEGGHVKESAKCLENLFAKFPDEPKLTGEIEVIMDTLRNATLDQETMESDKRFYIDMFGEISEAGQKRMIISTAESSKDSLVHCKLMLILITKFKSEIVTYGEKLLETINSVEKHEVGGAKDPLNLYRKMLVVDILPAVFSDENLRISPKLLLKVLYKAQEFVLAYVNNSVSLGFDIKNPWRLLYSILNGVGQSLGWSGSFNLPNNGTIPVEEYLAHLTVLARTALSTPSDSVLSQQLFHSLSCVVLHTVSEYSNHCQEQNTVMVEAWVTHDTQGQDRDKHKRRKTQDDPTSSQPVLSHQSFTTLESGSPSPLLSNFQRLVSAWGLLVSSQLECDVLNFLVQLRQTVPNLPVQAVQLDYRQHAGQAREALGDVRHVLSEGVTSHSHVWTALKLATIQHCLGDQRSAAQHIAECVAGLHSLPEGRESSGGDVEGLTIPTNRSRHCRFIPLTRPAVLTYCCKLLTGLLQERALQGDLATGHTITIMQYNWPDDRELFYHLLNRVRAREGFSYPLFCQYIINIEILEEIMFLASEQGGGLVMDIVPGSGNSSIGSGTARMGTRGANRGEREEFRSAMRKQAARSHESVDRLIVDFLTNHTELILQTLA